MKKCPYCAEEIQDEAIVCRYCGRDLDNSPKTTTTSPPKQPAKTSKTNAPTNGLLIGVLVLVITCALILVAINARGEGGSVSKAPDEQDAFYMCQVFVERALKSPTTAKFASWSESEGEKLSGNQFIIGSYVDSENSFGAMIRTKYVCTITYTGNDQWKLDDLVTE